MIGQAAYADRRPAPDWQVEDLFRNFRHALENGAAAGEDDARVERLLVTGAQISSQTR